jgi:hypothetical protein
MLLVEAHVKALEIAQAGAYMSDLVRGRGFAQRRAASQEKHNREQAHGCCIRFVLNRHSIGDLRGNALLPFLNIIYYGVCSVFVPPESFFVIIPNRA